MVTVPCYDELSVKNLWPHMKLVPEFMQFMPDSIPKNRLPSRDYFFSVMNTLNPEYVQSLIKHPNPKTPNPKRLKVWYVLWISKCNWVNLRNNKKKTNGALYCSWSSRLINQTQTLQGSHHIPMWQKYSGCRIATYIMYASKRNKRFLFKKSKQKFDSCLILWHALQKKERPSIGKCP